MSKTIIFDTETTGLEQENEIIEIGAIIIDSEDKNYYQIFNELCQATIPIKIEAMATHGIREDDIKNKPFFKDSNFYKTLKELNNKNNYLVAHNLEFDLSMLKKYDFENNFKLIDTLNCVKHLYKIDKEINGYKLPNYKLQTFRYILLTKEEEITESNKAGNGIINAHSALSDVIILKLVLRKIILKVKEKFKLTNFEDIMNKLVELTNTTIEIEILNFGKYKGKKLTEILKIDKDYLMWLYGEQKKLKQNNDSKFDKDLFYSLEKILNKNDDNKNNSNLNKQNALNF